MDACYAAAYSFYNERKFSEALPIFGMLCMCDCFNANCWMGLGLTRQMLEDFSGAFEAFSIVRLLDPASPIIPFCGASSLLALGDKEQGKVWLNMALQQIEELQSSNKDLQEMRARIKATLAGLKSEAPLNKVFTHNN